MLDKLQALEDKFLELEGQISDPAVMADMVEWQRLTKAHSKMALVVEKFREYKKMLKTIGDAREMLQDKLDDEFREMVEAEYNEAQSKIGTLEEELRISLLPKDPNDDKNVIVEIRGGAGGDEAALFAGDLFRMYTRYAEKQGWRVEMLDANAPELGASRK